MLIYVEFASGHFTYIVSYYVYVSGESDGPCSSTSHAGADSNDDGTLSAACYPGEKRKKKRTHGHPLCSTVGMHPIHYSAISFIYVAPYLLCLLPSRERWSYAKDLPIKGSPSALYLTRVDDVHIDSPA